MKKTKDEILMVALGVKHFTSLEMWQREQLYYAMDEWATQHQTAQLQQHGVMQAKGSDGYKEHGHGYSAKDKLDTSNPPRQSAQGAAVGQRSGGAKRERRDDDVWNDLGNTLYEMSKDEPEW